jgi:transposase
MAYSVDTRKMVLEYLNKGHTEEEAKRELGISIPSMTKWRKMLRETGNLEDKERQRTPHKLPDEELKAYIASHPDAFYTEIAANFKCSDEGVRKACKRLGITRKKKTKLYKERDEEKRQKFLEEIKDISPCGHCIRG